MNKDEIVQAFDEMAPNYDTQWSRMAPITNTLYFFMESLLKNRPKNASILCVGAGTGREIAHLAQRFPSFRFTVVEPAKNMMERCIEMTKELDIYERCTFHCGFLDSLGESTRHDAATSLLVSHFLMDMQARSDFFAQIALRLKPRGLLINADLTADTSDTRYAVLLDFWITLMMNADLSQELIDKARQAYTTDVAILSRDSLNELMMKSGFEHPTTFYQAGMIQAQFAIKPN
ncbi:class I SAM-dependent methyltransferase [Pseudoalteromonas xiamenensis]|uniref:class I SAM-dependent methyltransferase n=1 Tax=Pseudoalteromonas xiamenensis TaxID=882626 RepID=UPI0027E50F55|nr:class I SAM-dependent methyltransferase [Pseudoalteromonas xiamenensis]WMN60684.1 class I SAM-dependent methyltransferase [Pseudoalteromonas xiamenensis]WMN60781.1 class I SAM-dependent methyltransferase [Pseudoalteromonas xiamenensis]